MNRLFYLTIILGLLLIILNIFFDLSWIPEIDKNKDSLIWILTVLSKTCSTVGLALLLGNLTKLFNKKDEQEKDNKRKQEINDIVNNIDKNISQLIISKDFLRSLSDTEKRNVIATLLTPENSSLNEHSNIKQYLDAKSNNYLNFFNINFRSNFTVNIKVNKDKNKNKYVSKYEISYRIYKIDDKYQPVSIVFDKETDNIKTIIKDNHGNKLKTLKKPKDDYGNKGDNKYIFTIPEEYYIYPFLTIEREVKEWGHTHWITLYWNSLTPIDGIIYTVTCNSGIIKEHRIFDNENYYNAPKIDENRKTLTIKSSQWLDPYTGISVVIADESDDDDLPPICNDSDD